MPSPTIIALTGQPGAGKDLIAVLLGMRGYQRLAFGDKIKDEVVQYLALTTKERGKHPFQPTLLRETKLHCEMYELIFRLTVDDINQLTSRDVHTKPTSFAMRKLLQWWGTEFRRAQDPFYWCHKLTASLPNASHLVVSDLRFREEYETLMGLGARVYVWKVINPRNNPTRAVIAHESEVQAQEIPYNVLVNNNGNLWELGLKVRRILASELEYTNDSGE